MKINNYKYRIIWVLLAIASVLVLLVGYFSVIHPRIEALHETQKTIVDMKHANEQKKKDISNLRLEAATIGDKRARLEKLREEVPVNYDQEGFIHQLNDAAGAAGVSLQNVTFSDSQQITTGSAQAVKTGEFVGIPVSVSAQGGYDQLRAFVDGVQHMTRIALLTNTNYNISDDGNCTATISMAIYSLIDEDESNTATGNANTQSDVSGQSSNDTGSSASGSTDTSTSDTTTE